jgi:hypothetical protein
MENEVDQSLRNSGDHWTNNAVPQIRRPAPQLHSCKTPTSHNCSPKWRANCNQDTASTRVTHRPCSPPPHTPTEWGLGDSFPGVKRRQREPDHSPNLVPSFRMNGAVNPLPHTPLWHAHGQVYKVPHWQLMCGQFCVPWHCTVIRRLTTGIRSEKCVVRQFRRCANVI